MAASIHQIWLSILLHQWWLIVVLLLVFFAWVLIEILLHHRFCKHLSVLGYVPTRRFKHLRIAPWLSETWNAQVIGITWFLRYRQWALLVVVVIILFLSGWRALEARDALEFARAGALVVIAAVLSAVFEHFETTNTKKLWYSIDDSLAGVADPMYLENIISNAVEGARRRALSIFVGVSVLGTLVWAYGDQFMACEIFGRFGIEDSNVRCF